MQVASVISSGRSQFMVLGWIFQKGRLFSSLTLASSSDAQSEGAILQQFLITCPRLLFLRLTAAWQSSKSERAKVAILEGGKMMIYRRTDRFFESPFRERAMLSPYLLRISFAITSKKISKWAGDQKRVGEQLSLLCAVCPVRGKSDGPWWALVLRSILSMFAEAHPRLVAVRGHLRKARLLGWVNDLFNSYTCFKIMNISCLTFYTFYSKSSQDGQEEQPNFCDWSRINTLNAW